MNKAEAIEYAREKASDLLYMATFTGSLSEISPRVRIFEDSVAFYIPWDIDRLKAARRLFPRGYKLKKRYMADGGNLAIDYDHAELPRITIWMQAHQLPPNCELVVAEEVVVKKLMVVCHE